MVLRLSLNSGVKSSMASLTTCPQHGICHSTAPVRLTDLAPGSLAIVDSLQLDASDAALLRAMGVSVESHIKLCRAGHPCILAVVTEIDLLDGVPADSSNVSACQCQRAQGFACCSSRIGLARELAEKIVVRPLNMSVLGVRA